MSELWTRMDAVETPKNEYALIPEGLYAAEVTDVEIKEGDGLFLETEIKVEFTLSKELVGRKCWWNTKLKAEASNKQLQFIKGQICKLAGVDTTAGDPMGVLIGTRGNQVMIDVKHKAGFKDATKTFMEVYVREKIA